MITSTHNTHPPIIVDTSALISLASVTDSNHSRAQTGTVAMEKAQRSAIVPGEIVTETINVVGKKVSHDVAIRIGQDLLRAKEYNIVETTLRIRRAALKKFAQQSSAMVSFTDCLVMAFADDYKTKDIFGFDDAFRKNGYNRLGIEILIA